jgi:hypothetical protein
VLALGGCRGLHPQVAAPTNLGWVGWVRGVLLVGGVVSSRVVRRVVGVVVVGGLFGVGFLGCVVVAGCVWVGGIVGVWGLVGG